MVVVGFMWSALACDVAILEAQMCAGREESLKERRERHFYIYFFAVFGHVFFPVKPLLLL